jgi:hypothetical protein
MARGGVSQDTTHDFRRLGEYREPARNGLGIAGSKNTPLGRNPCMRLAATS